MKSYIPKQVQEVLDSELKDGYTVGQVVYASGIAYIGYHVGQFIGHQIKKKRVMQMARDTLARRNA